MASDTTIVAGIEIPSVSPVFLTVVGIHVLLGIACVITGVMAMLSEKRHGRHPQVGTIYYWCLSAVFATATFLSVMRWAEDYHLFTLGSLSFTAAFLGRTARRQGSIRLHITGMGLSYILLLTAFYVDNGHSLPLWKVPEPPAQPHSRVVVERAIRFAGGADTEVIGPSAKRAVQHVDELCGLLLPPIAYWLVPGAVGIPIIIWALVRHPLVRHPAHRRSEVT
jgi:uncharacterized membrane protein